MNARLAGALCCVAASVATATRAHADPDGSHGSIGAGGELLLTGDDGARQRLDVAAELFPGGNFARFGGELAWREVDRSHGGLLTAGIVYVAAASRPRLVLALQGNAGADLDVHAPVVGGGIRATLEIEGPLAVALDSSAELVIDGLEHSRLVLAGSTLLVMMW